MGIAIARPTLLPGAAARPARPVPLAVRVLARELARARFAGYRFRPRERIGVHPVDFYCPAARLAIVAGGIAHDTPAAQRRRRHALRAAGIAELAFARRHVLTHLDDVLAEIHEALLLRVDD